MRIIKISRKFDSGGRKLEKRLADISGFDYYDREIIYGTKRDDPKNYSLTINTTCFEIKLAPAVADYVMHLIGGQHENTII